MRRVPELDGLRGLAAVAVVLHHAFPVWFAAARFGVDLFFVLSGYLITTIILDGRREPGFLGGFYLKRVFRIWPVYFVTLAAVLAANSFTRLRWTGEGLAYHLAFLQNLPVYWGAEPPPFVPTFGVSWSVAMEEQYYLVWPLLVLWLGPNSVPALSALLLAGSVAGRACLADLPPVLLTRGDGLALGCLLAWLLHRPGRARAAAWFIGSAGAAGAAYAAAYLWHDPGGGPTLWPTTAYLGFSLLWAGVIGAGVRWSGRAALAPLRCRPLLWCGTISYALYMFHLPVFYYAPPTLGRLGVRDPSAVAAATWACVFLLPVLSWVALERPAHAARQRVLRRLRDRRGRPNP